MDQEVSGRIGSADPATQASPEAATASSPSGECPLRGFTPVPWLVRPREDGHLHVRIRGTRLGEKFKIANTLMACDDEREEQEAVANANFIVRACNAHDELVQALQWALDELNGRTRYDEDCADQQIENCYALAEAALAKARANQVQA